MVGQQNKELQPLYIFELLLLLKEKINLIDNRIYRNQKNSERKQDRNEHKLLRKMLRELIKKKKREREILKRKKNKIKFQRGKEKLEDERH